MRPRKVGLIVAIAAVSALVPAASAMAAPTIDLAGSPGATSTLRPGAVYAATNEATGNRIQTFIRDNDGTLVPGEAVPTGGAGSGGFEGSANGVVLASRGGEASPNNLTGGTKFLLATNTGGNSVSVLRERPDGLELVEVESERISHPISVTVQAGVVYVLNGGTTNCIGGAPTITGFTLDADGQLTPIPGSTRPVSGGANSGCAQVSFDPSGETLVVTEKQQDVISTYSVDSDGIATGPITNQSSGLGPFGFTFTQTGRLLTSENFGGAPGQGAAASYRIEKDSTLTPVSGSVKNNRSDTCWIVLTDNGKYAYVTNAMTNDISSYRVEPDGSMTLLESVAGPADELPGPPAVPADLSLSGDSHYLYAHNVRDGDLFAFEVNPDGTLTPIQTLARALPPGAIGIASK